MANLEQNLERINEELKRIIPKANNPKIALATIKQIKKELRKISTQIKSQENKLELKLITILKNAKKDSFTREDLYDLFPGSSKKEIIKILNKLIRQGRINRIGWGIYSLQTSSIRAIVKLSPEIENMQRILLDKGINFLITGLDILLEYVNLIPKRISHLIYVAKGSGEYVTDLLEQKNKMCILNPNRTEVRNLFSHYGEDIVIIREVGETSIEYHKQGIASIEKAIVDLYFETTRKRIPFETSELANILQNVLRKTKIDYTMLLRAASRRNMQGEFIRILTELQINIPLKEIEEEDLPKAEKVINFFR
ncbi:hypothetical protein HZC30_03940 [Candidatus Woesearchaeota archaeon]|nr:hypothetical protein [Candidatus Woesearchaeota archaeon]